MLIKGNPQKSFIQKKAFPVSQVGNAFYFENHCEVNSGVLYIPDEILDYSVINVTYLQLVEISTTRQPSVSGHNG